MTKNIFAWGKIQLNKSSGKCKAKCPECIDRRTDKKDKSLQVNFENGIAYCHYCNSISFRDPIDKKTQQQNYKLPVQIWRNYTKLSEPMVRYIESRKISQSTAIKFGLTEEKFYQPQIQKEVNNIVFNYFEGDILINKKYRSGCKHFTQSAGTKSIFYNINSIIGQEEIWIVEGEFDVLALWEIGIKNCISLPNGANNSDTVWENCAEYLKDIKKFIIATDNDEKGNIIADKIAQRLGKWRCERVLFENKDANGDLIAGILEESVLYRKKYPVSGTFTANDIYDDILKLYHEGLPPTIYPKHSCFGNLNQIFSVMRGHLVTCTGIPSSGKSNFVEWYILNLVKDYNMKASFFSPEHSPMELHQSAFIEKTFGKNFIYNYNGCPKIDLNDIARYTEWSKEKIYLTAMEDGKTPNWDWLLDKFKEQMITYGIDIFVVDAFNKVHIDNSPNHLQQINAILTKLTAFAQINNVIVFLVAHPTKMKKDPNTKLYDIPSLYDVSGSADFRNQTHDGFCIHRFYDDENGNESKTVFINLKTKYKFQGQITGKVAFDYHIPSGRYYVEGTDPNFDLLTWDEKSENISQILAMPEDAFDLPDIPF